MPKILWMSPYSLHDISSGASIHCRCILEALSKSGVTVWAFSSFIFDRYDGGKAAFGNLKDFFNQYQNQELLEFDDRGIHYIYTHSKQTTEIFRTCNEQLRFFEHYCDILDFFKPDIVIGYGTGMDSYTCFAEASRRKIATVYLLLNGKHGHFSFPHIDLVLTDSQTTSELYAKRDGINCTPIGQFIDCNKVISKTHHNEYITMINPALSKGVAIFAKMAQVCLTYAPELKFLVVNSRETFNNSIEMLHELNDQGNRPFAQGKFKFINVIQVPLTDDIAQIYAQSKVCVIPSLAYESWGRIASEALLNNIPVLGANIGGIPEAINGGGVVLTPPQYCIDDISCLPTTQDIMPWIEALIRLINEDWTAKIEKARTNVDPQKLLTNLLELFRPYFTQSTDFKITAYGRY